MVRKKEEPEEFEMPEVTMVPIDSLKEPDWNCRIHTQRGIDALVKSIGEVGYIDPVVVWQDGVILAGAARWKAAKKINMPQIPVIDRSDLSEAKAKWYSLASNRIPEFNGYDELARYDLAKSIEDTDVSMETLFTDDELEETRRALEDIDVDLPDVEGEEGADAGERVIQNVEVLIQIPAGLWPSVSEEVSSLVKGIQERHPEVLYTIQEVEQ